jgi:hypothetical protein
VTLWGWGQQDQASKNIFFLPFSVQSQSGLKSNQDRKKEKNVTRGLENGPKVSRII